MEKTFEDELAHFGIKGMRWGVRRKDPSSSDSSSASDSTPTGTPVHVESTPGKGVRKTSGGQKAPVHPDAAVAAGLRQMARASTTDALSNTELASAIKRMNLEEQYHRLVTNKPKKRGPVAFVASFLSKKAAEDLSSIVQGKEATNINKVKNAFDAARSASGKGRTRTYRHAAWGRPGSPTRGARKLNVASDVVKGTVIK